MFLPFGSALIGALLTIEKQTAIQLSSQLWYVVRRLQTSTLYELLFLICLTRSVVTIRDDSWLQNIQIAVKLEIVECKQCIASFYTYQNTWMNY